MCELNRKNLKTIRNHSHILSYAYMHTHIYAEVIVSD